MGLNKAKLYTSIIKVNRSIVKILRPQAKGQDYVVREKTYHVTIALIEILKSIFHIFESYYSSIIFS